MQRELPFDGGFRVHVGSIGYSTTLDHSRSITTLCDHGRELPGTFQLVEDPRAYVRIAARLRDRIRAGGMRPGAPVPSITTIVQEQGVARQTAGKVLRLLEDEGWSTGCPALATTWPTAQRRADVPPERRALFAQRPGHNVILATGRQCLRDLVSVGHQRQPFRWQDGLGAQHNDVILPSWWFRPDCQPDAAVVCDGGRASPPPASSPTAAVTGDTGEQGRDQRRHRWSVGAPGPSWMPGSYFVPARCCARNAPCRPHAFVAVDASPGVPDIRVRQSAAQNGRGYY